MIEVTDRRRKNPLFWKKLIEKYVMITTYSTKVERIINVSEVRACITKTKTTIVLKGVTYNPDFTLNSLPMVDVRFIDTLQFDDSYKVLIKLANEEEYSKLEKSRKKFRYDDVPF